MNDRLWKNFENTGTVAAYLAYRGISVQKESKGNGEDSSNGNRSGSLTGGGI